MTQTRARPIAAIALAAGIGQRMRPVTDRMPKPLIPIGGRALLDHALDRLADAGVERAVVNVHHFAEQVERHVAARLARGARPAITISDERGALLETGGGARKALPLLGPGPFIVMNSDSLWLETGAPVLPAMIAAWEPARMDMLLLVAERAAALGFDGQGDFTMDGEGRLIRRAGETAPFVFAGVSIATAGFFADTPEAFSLNLLFDRAIARRRLFGFMLAGRWLHVGTPDAIAPADALLAAARAA